MEFKLEEIIGIQKHAGKVRKDLSCSWAALKNDFSGEKNKTNDFLNSIFSQERYSNQISCSPNPTTNSETTNRKFKIRISELVVGSGESDQNDFVPAFRNSFSGEWVYM